MSGGYTPAFASIYDGTLYGKWPAAPVWASLLPLIDHRGEIRLSYEAIAGRTGWPMDLLKQGIYELMQPDSGSQSPADEGRRLVLLDPACPWGWRAVNHKKYRDRASGRAQVEDGRNAKKVRKYKERHRETPKDTAGHLQTPTHTHTHTQTKNKNLPSGGMSSAARPTAECAEDVFEHWKKTWKHPGAIFDEKRRKRIEARLKDFTPEQLCNAISGFKNSPWHCGTDPKGEGTVYDSIDTLLRDTAQVETGLRLLAHPPRPPPRHETATDRLLRNLNGSDDSRVIDHESEILPTITNQ